MSWYLYYIITRPIMVRIKVDWIVQLLKTYNSKSGPISVIIFELWIMDIEKRTKI